VFLSAFICGYFGVTCRRLQIDYIDYTYYADYIDHSAYAQARYADAVPHR
jgi:hypothetical protein